MDPSSIMNNPMYQSLMQAMMSDPEIMQIMQNPSLLEKLQNAGANPMAMQQLMASDPDVAKLMGKVAALQMGGGMGGMPGMGGFGQGQQQQQQNTGGNKTQADGTVHIKSSAEFDNIIKSSGNKPVCCDFTASWCGPCKMIAPTFSALAQQYKDQAVFLKIDGDLNQALCAAHEVKGFPTFKFFVGGKLVETFVGAQVEKLKATVADLVKANEKPDPNLAPSPYKHFPLKVDEVVSYKQIKYEPVVKKLNDVCKELREDKKYEAHAKKALDETELKTLNSLVSNLNDMKSWHVQTIPDEQYNVIDKLLTWPAAVVGSGLHLVRVLLLHPHAATYYAKKCESKDTDLVVKLCNIAKEADKAVTAMLAVRAIANFFNRRVLQRAIAGKHESVIDICTSVFQKYEDEETRLSVIGVMINFAIVFREDAAKYEAGKVQCLSSLIEVLKTESKNTTLIYRVLVIVGTLVFRDDSCRGIAVDLEANELVQSIQKAHSANAEVNAACTELLLCLKPPAK